MSSHSNQEKFPKPFNTKAFSDLFSVFDQWFNEPLSFVGQQLIKVDMYVADQNLVIEADVPGVKKEQIQLELHTDGIKISVEEQSQFEEINEKEKYLHKERSFTRRERFIPLDVHSSPKNIKAKYEDGILLIRIPKYNLKDNVRSVIDIE